jgi:hypothetical protein
MGTRIGWLTGAGEGLGREEVEEVRGGENRIEEGA